MSDIKLIEKICAQCNESKSLDEFYEHAYNLDGRCGNCKECRKKNSKLAYQGILEKKERLGNLLLGIRDNVELVMKEMKLNV